MKRIASPMMRIVEMTAMLPMVMAVARVAPMSMHDNHHDSRSMLSLAQNQNNDAEKNIPLVKHNKIKGGKYAEGSVLFNKQEEASKGKTASALSSEEKKRKIIEEGEDKVSVVFCIMGFIFALVVYAMFQVQIRGKDINPVFSDAVSLSIRVGVFAFGLASLIWFPPLHWLTTDDFKAKIPLVICLYYFTVTPILGNTICNAWAGAVGTFWAFIQMYIMNGIFPGGLAPGDSMFCAAALFGWANFFLFLFVILWCKCTIGMKMFALANAIGFMLAFMNPASTVKFSENFQIDPKGTAVNVLMATWLACAISPVVNLFPTFLSSAFMAMRGSSTTVSSTTARLFEEVVEYYGGSSPSVRIETHIKKVNDLRGTIDGMGGTVGAAWWECFDMGKFGTIRALMAAHQSMAYELHDRLTAALVSASTEDFGDSHVQVMQNIITDCRHVVKVTGELLNTVTAAAGDGNIDSGEKASISKQINEAKVAVSNLAKEFDTTRRSYQRAISLELLGESFFVLTLSAYARIVWEYAEMLITNPPKAHGFGADVMEGIKSTWSGLTSKDNMFFTLKHFIALSFTWTYAILVDSYGGACVITSVFLINGAACPDVQALLNSMNAVILAAVVGSLVFEWSCQAANSVYVLPFLTMCIWMAGLYGVYSKSRFATACIFIVALVPFNLIKKCPAIVDPSATAAGTYAGMVGFVLAIIFVGLFQYILSRDRASNLALESLGNAYAGLKSGLAEFWVCGDMKGALANVSGDISTGNAVSASAAIEPRFWRVGWNHKLYTDVTASLSQIRLDFLMMWCALAGSGGAPENIFEKIKYLPDFKRVEEDLTATFLDCEAITTNMLAHTHGMLAGLNEMKTRTGIDNLEALVPLIDGLNRGALQFPKLGHYSGEVGQSLEDDDLCQLSTVLLMLQCSVKHMASLLMKPIKNV